MAFSTADLTIFSGYLFVIISSLLSLLFFRRAAFRLKRHVNIKKLASHKTLTEKLNYKSKETINPHSLKQDAFYSFVFGSIYLLGAVLVIVFSGWLLAHLSLSVT